MITARYPARPGQWSRPRFAALATGLALATQVAVSDGAAALVASTNDGNSATANAVVRVVSNRTGGSCTGTLIHPRLVLTAWHCVDSRQPNKAAFDTAMGMAHANGSVFMMTRTPARLWARTMRAPLGNSTTTVAGSYGPFVAMTAQSGRQVIGATAGGSLVAVDVDTNVQRVVGTAPGGLHEMATTSDGYTYAATSAGRLLRSNLATGSGWADIGPAPAVAGMAAIGSALYVATTSDDLLRYFPNGSRTWDRIGHANDVVAMTDIQDQLLVQTSDRTLWTRFPHSYEEPWQEIGRGSELYTAMQVSSGSEPKWVATTASARLRSGDVSLSWTDAGAGVDATSVAAVRGRLYATTRGNRLLTRVADYRDRTWTDIGSASGVVAMTGDDASGSLWALTSGGALYRRSTGSSASWERVPDRFRPAGVNALAVNSTGGRFYATTTADRLWKRDGLGPDAAWTDVGYTGDAVGMHALTDQMVVLTEGGGVWQRHYAPDTRDWELTLNHDVIPGRWHSYAADRNPGLSVKFGNTGSVAVTATDYQVAGQADLALLRLPGSISSAVAVPMPVVTGQPTTSNPTDFWSRQTFSLVGWGQLATGASPTVRQRATANGGAQFPYAGIGGHVDCSRMTVNAGSAGGAPMPGDSGGPAIWTNSYGTRAVVGVVNVGGSGVDGIYAVTFSRGCVDTHGIARPNTGAWIESAEATIS